MKTALLFSMIIMPYSIGLSQTQNVGIGTLTPAFKLDVKNGSINTDSVYRIGAITILSVRGTSNLFVGKNAGRINTGFYNTFSGDESGFSNTTGGYNCFFGPSTGYNNTTGEHNSFFGKNAGLFNETGSFNSFFGRSAGYANISGTLNSALGFNSNVSTDALTNTTAIGANARVDCSNCMVLGAVNNVNGATSDVNVGIGVNSPTAKLEVAGQVKITGGAPGAGKVLTSDATGLASWQPPPPPPPTYYQSVSICCQSWMTKNLDVSNYRNGDPIPKVTDGATWNALTTGAYCYYNNDSTTYASTYGKLYNWYAVNDTRGLAPQGWHIPTDFEWSTLANCLGGNTEAGGPMKENGTTHWNTPNAGATNISGFTGLPGGHRIYNGFSLIGDYGVWWSSTLDDTSLAWYRYLSYGVPAFNRNYWERSFGFSVRCLKD